MTKTTKKFEGFSEEERAAMKARALELKAEERSQKNKANLKIAALVKKAVS